jgi:ABC-type Fe3+/spermidine/putrescine transport system ATPase subunit
MIAGLAIPTSGTIRIDGTDVTATAVRRRNIGMIFQDYALFPHMTVEENIGFGLTERRQPRKQVKARVRELLELIRLPGIGTRYPEQLSGGEQQRVALARALAYSPAVLLMDEPLGALDLKLREAMQIELHRLQRELRITTILVTHDQEEAMSLADRIAIMAEGRIQQIGAPEELYRSPANAFVAQFIGKVNFLAGTLTGLSSGVASVRLEDGTIVSASAREPLPIGVPARISVRPERLRLAHGSARSGIAGTVQRRRYLGNIVHYFVRAAWGQALLVEHAAGSEPFAPGAQVTLEWAPEDAQVFRSSEL